MKLTKQSVESLVSKASGDSCLWDTEVPGFGVRAQPGGRKVYVLRYRARCASGAQVQRKMTLCQTSIATLDKARAMAREALQKVATGIDPMSARAERLAGGAPTVEAMFTARIAAMQEKGRAMADEVERMLLKAPGNAADRIGRNRPPGDVSPADIVRAIAPFYKDGHRGAADKARSYLAAAFAWAIKSAHDYTVEDGRDWGVKQNPAAGVARDHGAMTARDRNLSNAEIRAVWSATSPREGAFGRDVGLCLRVMLACGQRLQETLRMDGADIDLEARLWTMPANKTKGRIHAHAVPLPEIILADLAHAKTIHGDGAIFPGRSDGSGETVDIRSVSQATRRWVAAQPAGIQPFQPRDLRRTWKSRAHDAGVDRETRDLIQQHARGSDSGTKHYDRANYSAQMRVGMDKWNAWLVAAVADVTEQ
jgi:integrase